VTRCLIQPRKAETAPRHMEKDKRPHRDSWGRRIAPRAMVDPVAEEPEAEVTAVAARDLERARQFVARHKISAAYGSYEQLLADPSMTRFI
jgi:DNA-binding GntR family transcriptional regulator